MVDFSKIFGEIDAEYNYGVMRITNVASTEIEMQVSNMVYEKASGVQKDIREGKTAADSYYHPDTVRFGIGELQEHKDAGAIYSIDRR